MLSAKKMLSRILALGLIMVGSGIAANDDGVVSLFYACDLGDDIAKSVSSHIEECTGARVSVAPCVSVDSPTVDKLARHVAEGLKAQDRFGILLFAMGTNEIDHTVITVKKSKKPFALIDLRTLQRDDRERPLSHKEIVRRAEKEALRALASLSGLAECPTMFCVAQRHGDIKGLDAKSYNYCPPCRVKIETLMRERGMAVKSQVEQIQERLGRRVTP